MVVFLFHELIRKTKKIYDSNGIYYYSTIIINWSWFLKLCISFCEILQIFKYFYENIIENNT